jgi:hypothetical protein
MNNNTKNDQVCCPMFDHQLWQDKVFEWNEKKFIREKVFTIFHIPLNFGQVMRRLDAKVRASGGSVNNSLCLSEHTSKWSMDLLLAVDKKIANTENTFLTGKFYSLVYEGPFKNTNQWFDDALVKAKEKGFRVNKTYLWYTTCPKCAKKYGKNYVVIFSEVDQA